MTPVAAGSVAYSAGAVLCDPVGVAASPGEAEVRSRGVWAWFASWVPGVTALWATGAPSPASSSRISASVSLYAPSP